MNKIAEIHKLINQIVKSKEEFTPGKTLITTGLAVFDGNEINAIIDSLLGKQLGLATQGKTFEKQFANYISTKYCALVNSGSSANLISLTAVKEHLSLDGGEIITPACGFPTTVNPMVQLGFTPVFSDVDKSMNISPESISKAITNKTKGIMFAHTLGNPAKIDEITRIAEVNDLFVIEDCCDAYGSEYQGKKCGSWGMASTYSFYPAHNITMGEGGAIATNSSKLMRIIKSLRDWGRDCYCEAGKDNTCGKRFDFKLGNIPYDHKYIFSRLGYNMKPLELQAAMGIEQLKRIDTFNKIRKRNYKIFSEEFENFKDFDTPIINEKSDPVFFGFPIVVNDSIDRDNLIRFLYKHKIATRLLFTGNITKQPAYKNISYRVCEPLDYTDTIMKQCFWIGVHPGITEEMIKYIISVFREYLKSKVHL